MGKPLRFIPPGSVVEVTSRIIQSRLLLRPSPEVNAAIRGVLGRALYLYKVKIFAFAFLSNHFHLLVSAADGEELARFMAHVKRNISDEIGRLHDWKGPLWERRYRSILVVDEVAQVDRLRYILGQGCPEGLVASPLDWPGMHCANPLLDGMPLWGTWTNRSAMYEANRRGKDFERLDFVEMYPVRLSSLPCWQTLTESERRAQCQELVSLIEVAAQKKNAELGRTPLGVTAILAQNPHSKPLFTNRSPAPVVHGSTSRIRKAFRVVYRCFEDMFRCAAERMRDGEHAVEFPLFSFPPARLYVRTVTAANTS